MSRIQNRAVIFGLFVVAGTILGVSLNKGCLNPALAANPLFGFAVFMAALVAGFLSDPTTRALEAARAAVCTTSEIVFNIVVFVCGVCMYSLVSWQVFQATPHLDDSVAALFHARIFTSGHLAIPLPERPEFFAMTGMVDARHGLDHLASMYPPGFPGVFVAGLLLGIPWITNPVLGAGLVVLMNRLGRELFSPSTGRLAAVLAFLSPFIMLQAGTFLSHIPTAFFLVLCMWAVCRLLATGRLRFGFLAGLGFGMAFLCRPLTALVVGLVIALLPIVRWRRALAHWRAVAVAGFMACLAALALAAFQEAITGDYRTPGHELGLGDRGRMGFGRLDGSVSHSPEQGWDYTRLRMSVLNHKVLGWPVPLFLVALLPFFLFRAGAKEIWLLLPCLALLAVYAAFWYYEWFYEARYIFAAVPMLILLSARGYACLKEALGGTGRLATSLLAGCVAFQVLVYLPYHFERYADNHGDVEALLPNVIASRSITNAIVYMDGTGTLPEGTSNNPRNSFYGTGFIRNSLGFDGDVVYARYRKGRNHLLAKDFPDRRCYLYRYYRPLNRALLYDLDFDRRDETRRLLEPRDDEPFLIGEEELRKHRGS